MAGGLLCVFDSNLDSAESGGFGLAPQVGLEPTTLRLTVAAGGFTTVRCDCLLSAETRANSSLRGLAGLLSIAAIF
jgi:hypothetical protein